MRLDILEGLMTLEKSFQLLIRQLYDKCHSANHTRLCICRGLQAFDVLEKELADKEYILGSEFTAADIAVGYSTAFLKMVQLDDEER